LKPLFFVNNCSVSDDQEILTIKKKKGEILLGRQQFPHVHQAHWSRDAALG